MIKSFKLYHALIISMWVCVCVRVYVWATMYNILLILRLFSFSLRSFLLLLLLLCVFAYPQFSITPFFRTILNTSDSPYVAFNRNIIIIIILIYSEIAKRNQRKLHNIIWKMIIILCVYLQKTLFIFDLVLFFVLDCFVGYFSFDLGSWILFLF